MLIRKSLLVTLVAKIANDSLNRLKFDNVMPETIVIGFL